MGTTATTPAPTPEKVEKKYSYLSAETFETVTETRTIEFAAPTTLTDAMERIGNDQNVVLTALKAFLKRQAFAAVKREVMSKGLNKTVVLGILRPFRALPPYSQMFELNADGSVKKDKDGQPIVNRKAQTDALITMLRDSPIVLAAVKAASEQAPLDSDSDEDEDDE